MKQKPLPRVGQRVICDRWPVSGTVLAVDDDGIHVERWDVNHNRMKRTTIPTDEWSGPQYAVKLSSKERTPTREADGKL